MTSPDADADPLALRDRPVVRLAVVLPADTALALYHYCLRSGADESKLPVATARIVAAFLERDADFKQWRDERRHTLPTSIPRRHKQPAAAGDHA